MCLCQQWQKGFYPVFLYTEKGAYSIWDGAVIFCTDCIRHSSTSVLPYVKTVTSQTRPLSSCTESPRTRWALHGLPRGPGARASRFICTQSQRMAASHSNCISAYGEGGRSRGAYYCGWNKFSRNGREDGKGSPLTLIWANDTAPASYNNIPAEKWFLDDRAAEHASDRRQWIN